MSGQVGSNERPQEGKQGWNYMVNSPKWHYFIEGRSLCDRWLGLGLSGFDDDPLSDNHPSNCAVCAKKVAKLRAKTAATITDTQPNAA